MLTRGSSNVCSIERFIFSEAPYRFDMKRIIICLGMLCALTAFAHAQDVTKAVATLESKSGSKVTGTVTFTKMGDDVQVVADIQNLTPGKHGFHIHEKGDCSAAD